MSMDFVTVLVCPDQGLADALARVEIACARLGAKPGRTYGYSDVEELAGRDVEGEELPASGGVEPVRVVLDTWRDVTAKFILPSFTAYVELVRWNAGVLNVFVSVDWRLLRELRRNGRMASYLDLLTALGAALKSFGGIGANELEQLPYIASALLSEIDQSSSEPKDLALFSIEYFPQLGGNQGSWGPYQIVGTNSYWIFTTDDFPVPEV